jgi:hypothetical protein
MSPIQPHNNNNNNNNGDDYDNTDNDNNSITFNEYLLTYRLKNTSAYYKASTKTQNTNIVQYTKTKHLKS